MLSLDEEILEEAKIEEDSLSEASKEESGEGSSLEIEELSITLVEETKGGVMEQAIIDKAKGKRVKFRMVFFFIVLTSAYHYRGQPKRNLKETKVLFRDLTHRWGFSPTSYCIAKVTTVGITNDKAYKT